MGSTATASLVGPGSATLTGKSVTDTLGVFQVNGTYSGVAFLIEGSADGSNYAPLQSTRVDTGALINGGTTIAPVDNSTLIVTSGVEGMSSVRLRATSLSSGTLNVTINTSFHHALPRLLLVSAGNSGASTFTGDLTISAADLVFSGTTGVPDLIVPDNLADALSIKISGGNDFIRLVSTNSAEAIVAGATSMCWFWQSALSPACRRANTNITTAGNVTYSAAEFLGGLILRDPNGASRSDTTPTAALLVAGLPGVSVNDYVDLLLINTADAAETLTLLAGTGVTLVPATIDLSQNQNAFLRVLFTNVGGGTEAVSVYGMVAGG